MDKTEVNDNFRIVLSGCIKRTLVGVDGLVKHAGIDNAKMAFLRAFNNPEYKTTVKLRRGLTIEFYSK